ncbi:MAG: hypothetical protein M3441_09555 [Chloroflexota bacterium]|nr:hypothetical protein [Chloroflexota bacterium]
MKWLTEDAKLICKHGGRVANRPSQAWVTVEGRKVLIEPDPEGRSISMCPNININIKPCTNTLKVTKGYSDFIFVVIDGKKFPVSLDTVTGLTDGTPPGTVHYIVKDPGQQLVTEGGR